MVKMFHIKKLLFFYWIFLFEVLFTSSSLISIQNNQTDEEFFIVILNQNYSTSDPDEWHPEKLCNEMGMELAVVPITPQNLNFIVHLEPSQYYYYNENEKTKIKLFGVTIWIFTHTNSTTDEGNTTEENYSANILAEYLYDFRLDSTTVHNCICLFDSSKNYWCQGLNCNRKNAALCKKSIPNFTTDSHHLQMYWKHFWIILAAGIVALNLGIMGIWLTYVSCTKPMSNKLFNEMDNSY